MDWFILKESNNDAWETISKACEINEHDGMALALEKIKETLDNWDGAKEG